MFCANCGAAVSGGNFCAVCGASLRAGPTVQAPPDPAEWADEVRYEVIVAIPEVRDRIAENFAAATRAADMQNLLDHIVLRRETIGSMGLASMLVSAMGRRGIYVSAERAELRQRPVGWVLADVLFVLAGCGYSWREVEQGTDGCVLKCQIDPSLRRLAGGTLTVAVGRAGANTGVRATAYLPGLIRDGGATRWIFDQVFDNLP
jgi:hypothetical protein